MEQKSRTRIACRCAFLVVAALAGALAGAAPASLVFSLEDHGKAGYTDGNWSNRPLVLFLADRKGSEHDKGYIWSSRIVSHARVRARDMDAGFVSVADLRGTPRLARGFVRNMFEPKARDPVGLTLLDWDGGLFRAYGLEAGAFHVLAFDGNHQLVYKVALREFEPARLAVVLDALSQSWPVSRH
jgi:hypothetical protein